MLFIMKITNLFLFFPLFYSISIFSNELCSLEKEHVYLEMIDRNSKSLETLKNRFLTLLENGPLIERFVSSSDLDLRNAFYGATMYKYYSITDHRSVQLQKQMLISDIQFEVAYADEEYPENCILEKEILGRVNINIG